jgi:hypothetical protein
MLMIRCLAAFAGDVDEEDLLDLLRERFRCFGALLLLAPLLMLLHCYCCCRSQSE